MVHARISGIASYAPDDILDNEMLSKMVDTNDEWITTRVGIKERRILKDPSKGSSFMGIKCVERLLESTGTKPEEVDLLICATTNPDYRFPSTGSIIAHQCGLKNAYSYDLQAACAGFLVALQDGSAYIRSGLRKKVIVVSAEKMSSMTNYTDRATCPLFGDGAGAMLLEPTEENVGIIDGVFHIDGEGLEHLWMPAGGSALPASHETVDAQQHYVIQDGRNVYKNAVTDMLESSQEVMERNNLTCENIDWFCSHQANLRIIEAVGARLGIDPAKVLVNIEKYGNTSAASIPLCLDEYKDKLKKGDKLILTAFGAGFTWGAMYIIWG
ncbi:beta-ketoacyl-ACP synthase III [Duncaniella freteri]|jgi:3-oxoacyl-[acyl-carrier-protein] synthase-3|uniref:Beta-ketoacyl-[acyl-carrier-protein] synthase III n=5 Tax=Duncaniella TaxID=2518495 RepID=A0A4Z0V9D0_9BACT|nr:beta-ketoacyl-ACP synthase III [Duncaniella freteri]MDE7026559.1 ketoacyl-ACP synthase III [Duncaniella freteri]NBJ06276.1 ketoacyl-ACP synthase III [Alistipes sp. Z76]NCE68365.1 ketoacyl-ACP synthase III [Muribaculaceae bacterium M3]TGG39920.1 ketoacyl-ACP synthase III [Duncaniella freteri]